MKKIITLVAVVLITFSATAQKKKAKGNDNTCYLEAAAATFELSEENIAKLNDLLTERLEKRGDVKKKARKSEITKEEAKTESKVINQTYFKSFADLAGKPKKEIMIFEKATKKKCN
ncbi:hypothetical protein [Winogradskyella psychrotolerans]|uniref:hypothetical protein n=1 Tax=Winogradskyella psychrotolerans TaxID=1344585 RepID=UPI001C07C02D|nr:hypothetical protein [Winogradskyella psychrotolerans]MBU2929872.1 hypothetical protein [Winogradskyella psychrotolerans]